jgi:hypothetical protein
MLIGLINILNKLVISIPLSAIFTIHHDGLSQKQKCRHYSLQKLFAKTDNTYGYRGFQPL